MGIVVSQPGTAYTRLIVTGPERMTSQLNALRVALDGATPGTAEMGWSTEMMQFGSPTRYVTTLADPTNTFTFSPGYNNFLANGTPIFFTLINTTSGIAVYTTYYVINTSSTAFQIEAVLGSGTPVVLTDAGSAHYARGRASLSGTTDVLNSKIVSVGHGLLAGDPVYVVLAPNAGAVPAINTTMYYVVNANPDDFQLSVNGVAPVTFDGTDGAVRYYGLSAPPFGVLALSSLFDGCSIAKKYVSFMILPNSCGGSPTPGTTCDFATDQAFIRIRAGANYLGNGMRWGFATTDPTTNTFTQNGHGLAVGDRVTFYELTNISDNNVMAGREYYVATTTLNTFTVSNSWDTSVVDFAGGLGTARFIALSNQNYDPDDATSYFDYEAQPFSTLYNGTFNIYATDKWCVLFCSSALPSTPRYGGKTNKFWSGVFEIKRENPNDGLPDVTGQLPFCYINGYHIGSSNTTYPLFLCRNYWGNINTEANSNVGVATTYGRVGSGIAYDGNSFSTTPGLLAPKGQKPVGLSTETGWALDMFIWQHGPYSTPLVEALCLGRIFGIKASTTQQGGVGSSAPVKIGTDYMYSSTGVAVDHQILTAYTTSSVGRFLIPEDIYPTP